MNELFKRIKWQIVKKSLIHLIVLLLLVGCYVFYKTRIASLISAQLQEELSKYIASLFIIYVGFAVHKIAGAIIDWYRENISAKTATHLDDELIPLLRRAVKVIVWIIVILVILPIYGINITALVAVLGVSSLAIALAVQDPIANIISGFLIMADRPFREGDRIKLPSGEVVKVLEIGIRRTRFLSEDNAVIIVPNLDLSKNKIINYTYAEEANK